MFLCDFLFMWIQVKAHTNCKQKFHFHYLILSNIVKLIILGLLSFVKKFHFLSRFSVSYVGLHQLERATDVF